MSGKLFLVYAPSGAGKTTLVNAMFDRIKKNAALERVVTYTSRPPREGEANGKDYHFISPLEFEQKIKDSFFLEWSGAYGNYYGTPYYIIERIEKGVSQLLVADYTGATTILNISHSNMPHLQSRLVYMWITVPSLKELKKRLLERGQDTKEQIEKRLALAQMEIEKENANPMHKYKIMNENFDKALKSIEFFLESELRLTV